MAHLQAAVRALARDRGGISFDDLKEHFGAAPLALQLREKVLERDGRADHLVLFKYHQVKTQFGDAEHGAVCREARGIILRMGTWEIVCYPFDKFFNATEAHADKVNWSAAVVQEKLDGSLMKVWYNRVLEQWIVSTNGMIDAHDARVGTDGQTFSFYDIFREAAEASGLNYDRLDQSRTYCFELLHPASTVVVQHPEPRLVHIGTRDVNTLEELLDDDVGVERPTVYPLPDLAACQRAADALPRDCEGYVVVDTSRAQGRIRRVKIKSPAYVALHHVASAASSVPLAEICAGIILTGEEDEVAAYRGSRSLADLTAGLEELRAKYDRLLGQMDSVWAAALLEAPTEAAGARLRKHFALAFQGARVPKAWFNILFGRVKDMIGGKDLITFDAAVREKVHYDSKAFIELVNSQQHPQGSA